MNNIDEKEKEKEKLLKYLKRIEKDLIKLLNMRVDELTLSNNILKSKNVSIDFAQKHNTESQT